MKPKKASRTMRRHEVKRASTLNELLRLEQVVLFELAARPAPGARPDALTPAYTLVTDAVLAADESDRLGGLYRIRVTVQHRSDDGSLSPLAEISVAFRALYLKAAPLDGASRDSLTDYLGIVGWMHVWPYLRAEVQTLSTRLGFPPLVLPVLLAGQTAEVPVEWVARTANGAKGRMKRKNAGSPAAGGRGK